jgi:hypothetical protein
MSLILGIRCDKGIVMAADSAATFGSVFKNTIRQASRKLGVIADRAIIGCSGPSGLSQRLSGELSDVLTHPALDIQTLEQHKLLGCLHEVFNGALKESIESAVRARELIRNGAQLGLGRSLLALIARGEPTLIYFDEFGCPEAMTDDLPFASVGRGQQIADPFLALLKRVLWRNEAPSIQIGILSALWTLDHAVKVNPGGIAEPIEIKTLRVVDGVPAVEAIPNTIIEDYYRLALAEAEKQLEQTLRTRLSSIMGDIPKSSKASPSGATEVPVPPSLPNEASADTASDDSKSNGVNSGAGDRLSALGLDGSPAPLTGGAPGRDSAHST